MTGYWAPITLMVFILFLQLLFNISHTHIEMRDEDNKIDITITDINIKRNAWVMVIAKCIALFSLYVFCLLIFSGKLQFLHRALKSYFIHHLSKIMFEIILFLPFVSKSFLGAKVIGHTTQQSWSIFISLFSIVGSSICGCLL